MVRSGTGHDVNFDAEVGTGLAKGGMCGFREDPDAVSLLDGLCRVGICSYISGSVIPRSFLPFSRALKQAMRIDSVPPLVVTPAAPSGALNIDNTCYMRELECAMQKPLCNIP